MPMYDNRLTIKRWAEEDRPREKLMGKGKSALSTAELLSILLRTGTTQKTSVELAKELLESCGNNLNTLAKRTVEELAEIKGIGQAKAIAIIAALEIGRRRRNDAVAVLPEIHSSRMAYEYILPFLEDLPHEEFWVVYLNRKNCVLRSERVSKGGISETLVDNKIIFAHALKVLATSMILYHNHPSGSPKPSQADKTVTRRIVESARLLDIKVLDHIILGDGCYYSFGDEGDI